MPSQCLWRYDDSVRRVLHTTQGSHWPMQDKELVMQYTIAYRWPNHEAQLLISDDPVYALGYAAEVCRSGGEILNITVPLPL